MIFPVSPNRSRTPMAIPATTRSCAAVYSAQRLRRTPRVYTGASSGRRTPRYRNISYGSDIPSSEPRTSSAPKSSSASSMETCRYRSASLMRQGIPSRAATKGRSGIREAISRERSDSPTPGACTGASASSAMAAASRDGFTSTAASKTFRCGICPTRSHSPVRESTTSPK